MTPNPRPTQRAHGARVITGINAEVSVIQDAMLGMGDIFRNMSNCVETLCSHELSGQSGNSNSNQMSVMEKIEAYEKASLKIAKYERKIYNLLEHNADADISLYESMISFCKNKSKCWR